jgi:hypothetical protein
MMSLPVDVFPKKDRQPDVASIWINSYWCRMGKKPFRQPSSEDIVVAVGVAVIVIVLGLWIRSNVQT